MKDILFIVHFSQVPGEVGNNRFNYLAKLFVKAGADVEIVTSDFSHRNKTHRRVMEESNNLPFKFMFVKEPGYKKNISLKRFYSHYVCGKYLKTYLKKRKTPDCIYCSIPSLSFGKVAAKYANKNNIPFFIDVQDLWPEAYKMVLDIPIISDIIFFPMKRLANKIYSSADKIFGVSKTYCLRALSVNKKNAEIMPVFLGTELSTFDEYKSLSVPFNSDGYFNIVYLGTLGDSYDINCIIDAIALLKDEIPHIRFVVIGDGILKKKFEDYALTKDINAIFVGRLEYSEAVAIMCRCDVAVNPIRKKSAASIINKVGDYAAAGIPVINTQESQEYCALIEEYRCGFNCDCSNSEQIAKKIRDLYNDSHLLKECANNHRKLAEEKFDRGKTYPEIIKKVMENII